MSEEMQKNLVLYRSAKDKRISCLCGLGFGTIIGILMLSSVAKLITLWTRHDLHASDIAFGCGGLLFFLAIFLLYLGVGVNNFRTKLVLSSRGILLSMPRFGIFPNMSGEYSWEDIDVVRVKLVNGRRVPIYIGMLDGSGLDLERLGLESPERAIPIIAEHIGEEKMVVKS